MLNAKYYIVPGENRQPQAHLNPEALGNGWFVEEIKWVNNANEEMSALDHFDPAKTAVIDKRFSSIFDTENITADSTASVKLTSYNPEELRYAVSSQKGGVVVFSEIYYPHGWKATVDGIETPIARTDYVLRAIYVPAGNHEVGHVVRTDLHTNYRNHRVVRIRHICACDIVESVHRIP